MKIKLLSKNKVSFIGFLFAITVICLAIFSPLISPYDPIEHNMGNRFASPSLQHIAGTDRFGRDVLSRMIWGSRTSLSIGFLATLLGSTSGTFLGLIAGYSRGTVGSGIMWLADVMLSFPTMVVAVIVVVALGFGTANVIIAIGVAFMPRYIRLARACTLSVAAKEYIEGSKAIGLSDWRIILKHVLPNVAGELIIMSTLWIATAIRLEASLSFLGLGAQPPTPSWGMMVKEGTVFFLHAPWLSLVPGGGIFLATMGFNMLGDGLRDALDPKIQS